MNNYRVSYDGEANIIQADRVLITNNGDLKFSTKQGTLLTAYAAGRWDCVDMIEDMPTEEQTGEIKDGSGKSDDLN